MALTPRSLNMKLGPRCKGHKGRAVWIVSYSRLSLMIIVVAAFNQEKALVGAFSVITNLRMDLFEALPDTRIWWPGAITLLLTHIHTGDDRSHGHGTWQLHWGSSGRKSRLYVQICNVVMARPGLGNLSTLQLAETEAATSANWPWLGCRCW